MTAQKIPEEPAGYLARAKAVYKLSIRPMHIATGRRDSLGEFLHAADVEGI